MKNYIAIQFLYCREEGLSRLGLYCNARNCIAMMLAMGWRYCIARLSCGGSSVLQEKGIVLQLECVMSRNCIAIPQSVLQEYAVAISVLQHGVG